MRVDIANHGYTLLWDGVYYFSLSNFPHISPWELRKLILFCENEKRNGRETEIVCGNEKIKDAVQHALENPKLFQKTQRPEIITECTACKQKGCLTDLLCHSTGIENAKSIFKYGALLSAVRATGKTGDTLAKEPRNAAKDPPDFFHYVMFSWGNCQAGDRLVMERQKAGQPLTKYDLGPGFKPGVRFYFRYDRLFSHRDFLEDGYTPGKIKNELSLFDYLEAAVVPEQNKAEWTGAIPESLSKRVHYLKHEREDIWDWSEKVYRFVKDLLI